MTKIVVSAGDLAGALGLANSLIDRQVRSAEFRAAYLTTAAGTLKVTTNILNCAVTITMPATVEVPGELAIDARRLFALSSGFSSKSDITISAASAAARIVSGRSHYMPAIPVDNMPAFLALDQGIGRVDLTRENALELLRPTFAIAKDRSRFYLCGLHLHDCEYGLARPIHQGSANSEV
jgi:DNA polymerase-3 subunit beta